MGVVQQPIELEGRGASLVHVLLDNSVKMLGVVPLRMGGFGFAKENAGVIVLISNYFYKGTL